MMNQQHIENLLDRRDFSSLSGSDLKIIETHCAVCPNCRRAFHAAAAVERLVQTAWSAEIETPPPFFAAKVVQKWRETSRPAIFETFRFWWHACATLIGLMILTALGLTAATLFAASRETETVSNQKIERQKLYSTDKLILDQRNAADELTTEDVYEILDNR